MRKEIAIGICFCLAGLLCACFFGYEYFTTYGFLNQYHMQSFANAKLDTQALMGNIIWERGKFFLLICIAAATPAKKIIPLVLRCGICFTAGIFLAACMLNMGVGGFVFFVVSLLPHGPFYFLALVLILWVDGHKFYNRKNPVLRRVAVYSGTIAAILAGCILESTLGVDLLRWAARLLMK